MLIYAFKTIISAIIIVLVTETAKRSGYLGALIKSLPLISIISFIWLYIETRNIKALEELSVGTFWLVIPTLPMFLVFPALLQQGLGFWPSLGISILVLVLCYLITLFALSKFGISF